MGAGNPARTPDRDSQRKQDDGNERDAQPFAQAQAAIPFRVANGTAYFLKEKVQQTQKNGDGYDGADGHS